jgi:hypothetical protein
MVGGPPQQLFLLASLALVVGIAVFVRGLVSYARSSRVTSIATSPAAALAAGEVRLTGRIEPIVSTLVSPLQSRPCVWYRSSIVEAGDREREVLCEERSVEFMLRDSTGTVRIVPRDVRWEVPDAFDESDSMTHEPPPGLAVRTGPSSTVSTDADREAAIASLLTVRPSAGGPDGVTLDGGPRRRYREARLEPGDQVTVLGFALPFGSLPGKPAAEAVFEPAPEDPTLGADLAEARDAGLLADTPEEAWGNAAIPGFGIGKPTETPVLDPGAQRLPAASPAQAEKAARLFEVPDEELVVSSGPGAGLVVYPGRPEEAAAQHDRAFVIGLGGATMATMSALALVLMIDGKV